MGVLVYSGILVCQTKTKTLSVNNPIKRGYERTSTSR